MGIRPKAPSRSNRRIVIVLYRRFSLKDISYPRNPYHRRKETPLRVPEGMADGKEGAPGWMVVSQPCDKSMHLVIKIHHVYMAGAVAGAPGIACSLVISVATGVHPLFPSLRSFRSPRWD